MPQNVRGEVDREPRQVHDRIPPKIYFLLQRHSAVLWEGATR